MVNTIKFRIRKLLISSIVLLLLFNGFYITGVADFEGRPDLDIDYIDFDADVDEGDETEFIVKMCNKEVL